MVIRVCGILIIYYKVEYLADVSIVVESDIKYALVHRIMIFGRDRYPLPQIDDLFDKVSRNLMFF